MTWRAALVSPAGGSRSLLRSASLSLIAPMAPRSALSMRSGTRGEIGLAVERRKNGAAHQGRAADAGQDRAGKPLHRDAAAIDDAAGAAVDRKRRLVAEIDGRRNGARALRAAQLHLIQARVPSARGCAPTAVPVTHPALASRDPIRRGIARRAPAIDQRPPRPQQVPVPLLTPRPATSSEECGSSAAAEAWASGSSGSTHRPRTFLPAEVVRRAMISMFGGSRDVPQRVSAIRAGGWRFPAASASARLA